jgi:hypothetical protein
MIFYRLCSIKDKERLTASNFEKLTYVKQIKNAGVQRANLQLLFQKISKGEKSVKLLDFYYLIKELIFQYFSKWGSFSDFL